MKILIVTQYFPPETGAPQARLYELGLRLQARGHEVTVLAAMPNYPTGRVFPAYRRSLRVTETIDGMRVVRTAIYPSNSARTLPRLLSYFSFALSSVLVGGWKLGRHEVAIVESPPLFLAPSGRLIAMLTRAVPVFMVSDIWPDILVRMGHSTGGAGLRMMEWLERWAYRRFEVVATTNPGAMRQIRERFPGVRTTVISNGVDTSFFRPEARNAIIRQELGAGDNELLVGYCGLHGLAQGLEAVVDAAEHLQDRKDVVIAMVGDGPVKARLAREAERRGLANIRFHERRPRDQMPSVIASCDLMLVPLSARLPGTMPSKVYEALAAGTPPLVAKGCEAEPLIDEFECGRTFEPLDGRELAAEIRALAGERETIVDMSRRARDLSNRFDRQTIADRTEQVLLAIAADEPLPEIVW